MGYHEGKILFIERQTLGIMGVSTYATIGILANCVVTPVTLNICTSENDQVFQVLPKAGSNRPFLVQLGKTGNIFRGCANEAV